MDASFSRDELSVATRDLFDPGNAHLEWRVLHTRSRQEKALAEDLDRLGIPGYLPLIHRTRLYGKRKTRVQLPLFPGYVFVRATLDQVYAADRTKRVAGIISVANQAQLNDELHSIHKALINGMHVDPYPLLKEGVWVEIRSGPLRGMRGRVESRDKMDRLILQIEMLGRAVSMEVDASLLELI